jgi:hypothetical protein
MKAEQRKELETNALADRMGHLVQRVKTQQRRTTLYWFLMVAGLLIALFLVFRWYQTSRTDNSRRWVGLEIGARTMYFPETPGLDALTKDYPETSQGKAARFQVAWFFYWELGIKRLGIESGDALKKLETAGALYTKLAEECADDPVWEPEALYALAVIEETRSVQEIKVAEHLEVAKKRYEDLLKKHKESARGKLADQWLKDYEDPDKRLALESFYTEMRATLNIRDPILPKKGLDFPKGVKKDTKPSK